MKKMKAIVKDIAVKKMEAAPKVSFDSMCFIV